MKTITFDITKVLSTYNLSIETILDKTIDEGRKLLKDIVKGVSKKDKKFIETITGDSNIDKFKLDLSKHITRTIVKYYKGIGVDKNTTDNLRYRIECIIETLIFNDVISSTKEKGEIVIWGKKIKKDINFLDTSEDNEENVVKINLKEDEYLEDSFITYLENDLKTSVEDFVNTDIKLLIKSPIGTGKSYMFGRFSNVVLLKDTITLVENSYTELVERLKREGSTKKVYKQYGDEKNTYFEPGSIIVSTYNQVIDLNKRLGSEWLFILDEEHKLITDVDFRDETLIEVLHVLETRGKYISMSGTPKSYSPLDWTNKLVVTKDKIKGRVKKLELINPKGSVEGRLYDLLNDKDYDSIEKKKTTIFYVVQNTIRIERIVNDIKEKYPNINVLMVTSDYVNGRSLDLDKKKEGLEVKSKISSGDFSEYDVVITSPLLREGVSLVTGRDKVIFLIDDNPDLITLIQQHDRVRKSKEVLVIIKDKDNSKTDIGRLKGDYYKFNRIEEDKEYGILTHRELNSIELLKNQYRLMTSRVLEQLELDMTPDERLVNGLNSIKTSIRLCGVHIIKNTYPISFLDKDLDDVKEKYLLDKKFEDIEWKSVLRYLHNELGFHNYKNSNIYTTDTRNNTEVENKMKEDKIEDSIDYIFNVLPKEGDSTKKVLGLDKITSKVQFEKFVLTKITNYSEEEMKDIIRRGERDTVGFLVMNWLISRRDIVVTSDSEKESLRIIQENYFRDDSKSKNNKYLIGLELSKLLVVGETYTSKEISNLLSKCTSNIDGTGFKCNRPKQLVEQVFNITKKTIRVGERKDNKKQEGYLIDSLKVDENGFTSMIKEEYLNNKLKDIQYTLESTLEDIKLVNPHINIIFNMFKEDKD